MGNFNMRYYAVVAAFSILVWILDATAGYFIAYPAFTFAGILITAIPTYVLTERIIFTLFIFAGGYFHSRNSAEYLDIRQHSAEQEKRYRLITENSNDVLWTMDLGGRINYISASVERLLGYTAPEIAGITFQETLTPGSLKIAKGLFDHFKKILATEPGKIPSVITELEHTTKKAGTVWAEASVTIIPGSNGTPPFFLGVSRDVSARKRKEDELRQSEENYRLLAETTIDFIMVHDTEGFITYANSAVLKATSYNIEEIKGLPFTDIIPGEYHDLLKAFAARREGDDCSRFFYEIEIFTRDRRKMPVEVSSAPLMVRNRAMAELITARDISERREGQRTLIENERRFRSYIEHSPVPVFIIDSEAVIRFVNNATAAYLGYPVHSFTGKNFATFRPEGQREKAPKQLERLVQHGKPGDEINLVCSDGREVTVMVRGTVLEDGSFLVYAVDITERILAERKIRETDEKIREMNAGLEEMVRERTEELMQANNELEAFSYSVSHDLRAPLRHISSFASMIQKSPAIKNESRLQHYFNNITGSVEKMNSLIDSLLSFSRMGRMAMSKTGVDMKSLVEDVLGEMKPELSGRDLRIDIGALGEAKADPALIRLVWYNLIANAVKFTRNRKNAVISIGREDPGDKIIFFIRDNGAGFDSSYKNKLFGVFQRLHSESEFEGTGIGLANVRRIVTRHGGEVWAEGETERGAVFYFSLP